MLLQKIINKLLRRPNENLSSITTDTGHIIDTNDVSRIASLWTTYNTRYDIWKDIENMDNTDEIISGSLDVIADRTTAFDRDNADGFFIEASDVEVQKILDSMVYRTGLDFMSWDIIRAMAKHGSHFCELVVVPDGNAFKIIRVKQFPRQYEIFRNEDKYGRLLDGDAVVAYRDKTPGVAAFDQIAGRAEYVASFFAWQIVHFRYGRMQGLPYPTPYFCSARKNWKRLQLLEDGLAVARLVRAYTKLAHEVLMPVGLPRSEQQKIIDDYRKNISKSRMVSGGAGTTPVFQKIDAPYFVDTDFFIPAYYSEDSSGRITKISPSVSALDVSNPQLQNLTDIRYSLNRLISRTKVPAKYLNFDIGQPRFSEQGMGPEEEQFGIVLKKVQMSYKLGVRQVCDLELMLHNINPIDAKYSIVMPEISIRNQSRRAQIEESYARAGSMWIAALLNAGVDIPWDVVGRNFMRLRGEDLQKFISKLHESAQSIYETFGTEGAGKNTEMNNSQYEDIKYNVDNLNITCEELKRNIDYIFNLMDNGDIE